MYPGMIGLMREWNNFYPSYKDSITGVPEGNNLMFFPQPRSILISKDNRYAFVAVFGFGLIRIDSKTGNQKYYNDNFDFIGWSFWQDAEPYDENFFKMINDMKWIDDENILLATANGFRIFDTKKETYTKISCLLTQILRKKTMIKLN